MEELSLTLEILFLQSPKQRKVILFGQHIFVESAAQSLKVFHTYHTKRRIKYSESSQGKLQLPINLMYNIL